MALIVCRSCRNAFISSPREEEICLECTTRLRELYPVVRSFLRDNEKRVYTAQDVSRIMGIDLDDVYTMASIGLVKLNTGRN